MDDLADILAVLEVLTMRLEAAGRTLDKPRDRMLRAQVRTAATELRKGSAMLREALGAKPTTGVL